MNRASSVTMVRPRLLTEAAMIAVVPLLAYYMAYLYEIGFAFTLNIPTRLISLNSTTLLGAGALSLLIIIISIGAGYYLGTLIKRDTNLWLVSFLFFCFVGVVTFIITSIGVGFNYTNLAITVTSGFTLACVYYLITLVPKGKKTKWRRFLELVAPKPKQQVHSFLRRYIADSPALVEIVLLFIMGSLFYAYMVGVISAMSGNSFLMIADSADTVVLRIYDDKIITMKHDHETGCLDGIVEVRLIDAANPIRLKHIHFELLPKNDRLYIHFDCPQNTRRYFYAVPTTPPIKNAGEELSNPRSAQ